MLADAKLGDPALTDELFPPYRADMPVITPQRRLGRRHGGEHRAPPPTAASPIACRPPARRAAWRTSRRSAAASSALPGSTPATGLAGDHQSARTTGSWRRRRPQRGRALLANDPHLGIAMPSIWFMNGLHCRTVADACPFDVVGVSFPGVPGGRPRATTPASPGARRTSTRTSRTCSSRRSTRPNPAATSSRGVSTPFAVRTRDDQGRRRRGRPSTFARPSTGRSSTTSTSASGRAAPRAPLDRDRRRRRYVRVPLPLNTAPTSRSSGPRFETYGSPSQNFVYADVDGHIGYVLPGPSRSGPIPPTAAPGSIRQRRPARLDRRDPLRRAALAAGSALRGDRHREQRGRRRALPLLHRQRMGPGLPGARGSWSCSRQRRPPAA